MQQRRNANRGGSWRWLLMCLGIVALCALGCADKPRNDQKLTVKIEERREFTPPPTLFEVNRRLPPRHKVLKAEGKPGEKLVIYRVYYRNGKAVRRVKIEEQTLEPPQPRIYEIGVHGHIASRGAVGRGASFRTAKVVEMHASAYTPHRSGGGTGSGYTASGLPAGYGLVAVDPRVIPLGTVLYIEGYGMAIAADTGRAIRGHKIDLCFATRQQALQFGRRRVRVHILRVAPTPPPKPPDTDNANNDAQDPAPE